LTLWAKGFSNHGAGYMAATPIRCKISTSYYSYCDST